MGVLPIHCGNFLPLYLLYLKYGTARNGTTQPIYIKREF